MVYGVACANYLGLHKKTPLQWRVLRDFVDSDTPALFEHPRRRPVKTLRHRPDSYQQHPPQQKERELNHGPQQRNPRHPQHAAPAGREAMVANEVFSNPDLLDEIFAFIQAEFPDFAPGAAVLKEEVCRQISGIEIYIPQRSVAQRERLTTEGLRMFDSRNAPEVARRLELAGRRSTESSRSKADRALEADVLILASDRKSDQLLR